MHYGQTNGIPQGSVLMDFVVEMVLGYADLELTNKLKANKVDNYYILRYRDDYRIFINNPQDGDKIIKFLTEVLIDLGMKINPSKIKTSSNLIQDSIKKDKLSWITKKQIDKNLEKHLLIIHNHANGFPNTGSLCVSLNDYYKRINKFTRIDQLHTIISIIIDIAYRNPRTYPICSAILSKLLSFIEPKDKKKDIINKIINKFSKIPNTGFIEIWLQRITLLFNPDFQYKETICKVVSGHSDKIWNNGILSKFHGKK